MGRMVNHIRAHRTKLFICLLIVVIIVRDRHRNRHCRPIFRHYQHISNDDKNKMSRHGSSTSYIAHTKYVQQPATGINSFLFMAQYHYYYVVQHNSVMMDTI